MKAARFYGVRDIRIEDVAKPQIDNNDDVIVKVKAAGICGSDLSKYIETGPHMSGEIIGHEFSGVVDEVGKDVIDLKIGDKVVVCPSKPCFKCDFCLQGKYTECNKFYVIGSNKNQGGFAEYVKIDRKNLIKYQGKLDFEDLATIEPSSVALHGMFRANINFGDDVVVVGLGAVGLFYIQWAKIMGASNIFAIDIVDEKLSIAKELGANYCINSKREDSIKKVLEITNDKGVDLAIESAGTQATCDQILMYPKKGGKVLYTGVPYNDILLHRNNFERIMRSELNIIGTWSMNSYPFPGKEWFITINEMEKGNLKTKPLITHNIELNELPKTLEKMAKKDEFFCKVMVVFKDFE